MGEGNTGRGKKIPGEESATGSTRSAQTPLGVRRKAFLIVRVTWMVEWRRLRGPIQECRFPNLESTAVLAAQGNGALAAWTDPIVTNNGGDGEVRLAHPPRIELRRQIEEEEIVLRREVLLDEQDCTRSSNLTGCQCTILVY